jgi:hypothetical protein
MISDSSKQAELALAAYSDLDQGMQLGQFISTHTKWW